MSKLSEYHIQLDTDVLLKNSIEFNSWIDSIWKNINLIPFEDLQVYENFYLVGIIEIIYAHHFGKIKKLQSTQRNLIDKLLQTKKINRLLQLKEVLTKLNILLDKKLEESISICSVSNNQLNINVSSLTAVMNSETYFQFSNIRKALIENISLIDPLTFIENLFKAITLVFKSDEAEGIIYHYAKYCDDNEIRYAVNEYFTEDNNYPELKTVSGQRSKKLENNKVIGFHIPLKNDDHLGNLSTLRLKLVDGCKSKQDYVNTLFEIALCYKKVGMLDRSMFFAMIVNRLIPDYRNVGALLRQ